MQLRPVFSFLGSSVRHRPRAEQKIHVKRAGALALAATATLLAGAAPPKLGDITVAVTDLRSGKGVVRACLTAHSETFPKCRKQSATYEIVAPAANGGVKLSFNDVPPGRYSIALLHDENGNGKIDRALGMMPREGFGFSRDAKVRMGPPKFDEAAFDYTGEEKVLTIRMRYML